MNRKLVLIMVLTFLIGMLNVAFNIQQAKADGTICIRADGSVDPPNAPIQHVGDAYALTGNVNGSLVIERSNIVFDGKGFTVDGLGGRVGVNVTDGDNVTVSGVDIRGCDYGIWFYSTSNCSILNNTVTGCVWMGITIYYSTGALLSDNNATSNYYGIWVFHSSFNTVSNNTVVGSQSYGASGLYIDHDSYTNLFFGNTLESNYYDIYLAPYSYNNTLSGNSISDGVYINNSTNNRFLHNNFITKFQISFTGKPSNMWDNGFEGNYWRLYNGTDSNQDGIGEIPYIIDSNNTDNYPLMGMFSDFPIDWAGKTYNVTTISNSTISDFSFGVVVVYPDHAPGPPWTTSIIFNATGDTLGFCRIMIPKDALDGEYIVTLDGLIMQPSMWRELPISNDTTLYLYLTYPSGSHEIWIMGTTMVPEFPSFLILPLFMIATLLAVMIYKSKCVGTG